MQQEQEKRRFACLQFPIIYTKMKNYLLKKDRIGFDARIVRAMPNTPALVGEGMTGVAYNPTEFNLEEKHIIEKIFKAIGKMKIVNEKLMSAVTCASGSSPAYVFMFIEAMADAAWQTACREHRRTALRHRRYSEAQKWFLRPVNTRGN